MNKNLTTTEKLEHLFSTLKRHLQLKGISAKEFDESSYLLSGKSLRNELFKEMIKISNYTKKPQVVSIEKYRTLPACNFAFLGTQIKSDELYRGSKIIEHHANLLCDEKYHVGVGDISNGLYATTSFNTALDYTRREPMPGLVLKLKIPEAKIIDDITLGVDLSRVLDGWLTTVDEHQPVLEDLANFVAEIQDEDEKKLFANLFFDDLGLVAILLGYDALYDHKFPSFALFNREKICVSTNEYNRICNASAYHKDFMIKE